MNEESIQYITTTILIGTIMFVSIILIKIM